MQERFLIQGNGAPLAIKQPPFHSCHLVDMPFLYNGLAVELVRSALSNELLCDRQHLQIHCRPPQIGILLCGVTIDNMIIGGPAYNSRQLEIGDMILQVDGVAATLASSRRPFHKDQT